jgi:aldehyde:ferredoxin oxidoreductase
VPFGYNGKILRVNLTQKTFKIEEPDEIIYRTYIGGGAFACYYLLEEQGPGVDPLGPENHLIFMTSAVSGTPGPGFSRFTVSARSPLTGAFAETEAGGWFGPELKFAGFDGIVIEGKAAEPVYLSIQDEKVEIHSAANLWGKEVGEVQDLIHQELADSKVRIAQIGPAGEKLVRYACIINELKHVNGRTGMGAVMGSKNLRAIAVRGSSKPELAHPEKVKELVKWFAKNYLSKLKERQEVGTASVVIPLNLAGILPTRNFNSGEFEHAEAIDGTTMRDTILVGRGGCYVCPVRCKREVAFEEPYSVQKRYGGPEYETVGALGSLVGVGDLKAIAKGNELCQRYGIDTISAGACIAFAMECYEHGILKEKDCGDIKLNFGNAEGMLKMIEMIARREGIGDLLAEGVLRAAKQIGKGSEKFAMHVKGQEAPLHDPRGKTGLGLAYALSPTGADHVEHPHDPMFQAWNENLKEAAMLGILEPVKPLSMGPDKVRHYFYLQHVWGLYNLIGLCQFVGFPVGRFSLDHITEYVKAVTGWNTTLWELLKATERSFQLFRVFNCREGFTKKDDTLPDRFFQPLPNGALKGHRINRKEFDEAIDLFYGMMGWQPDGKPTKSKLHEIGLSWLIPMIHHEKQ